MTFSDKLSLWSLIVNIVATVSTVTLAVLALRFAAKPKIKITPKIRGKNVMTAKPGEEICLQLELTNIGRFYVNPAAARCYFYINFPQDFDPVVARHGSALELINTCVKRGKSESKYFKIENIYLCYGEPGESIEVDIKCPHCEGKYLGWISAFCEGGDLGKHHFEISLNQNA